MGNCIGLHKKAKSVSECESVNTTDTGISSPEETGAPDLAVTEAEIQEGAGSGSITSTPQSRNTSAPLRELAISPIRSAINRVEKLFGSDWEDTTGTSGISGARPVRDEEASVKRTSMHSSLKDLDSSISTLGEAGAEEDNTELDDTVSLPAEETKFVTAKSEQSLVNDMGLPRLERCNAVRIPNVSEKKTEE